jgi:hypothetical protein
MVASNLGIDVWVKAGTYLTSNAGAGVYGGRIQTVGSGINTCKWEGYTTTRGDRSTKPIIKAGTQITGPIFESTGRVAVINIEVDSDNKNLGCFAATNTTRWILCRARNCAGGAGFSLGSADRCEAISCTTGFGSLVTTFACLTKSCMGSGYSLVTTANRCIDDGSAIGFNLISEGQMAINCIAYGGTGIGFNNTTNGNQACYNCVAVNRGGLGFSGGSSSNVWLYNCAGFNNTGGNYDITDPILVQNFKVLSSNPFTNSAGGDFSLNALAGGGAMLKATALPSIFPNGTLNLGNIGAVESSSVGGGETSYITVQ